jgi:hypothetical protein
MHFVYLFLTVEILKYSNWGLKTLLFFKQLNICKRLLIVSGRYGICRKGEKGWSNSSNIGYFVMLMIVTDWLRVDKWCSAVTSPGVWLASRPPYWMLIRSKQIQN